jgi:hypothetical protein
LGEFGVPPEAIFVVVFQAEDDIVLAGDGQEGFDAFDDAVQAVLAGDFGVALAA